MRAHVSDPPRAPWPEIQSTQAMAVLFSLLCLTLALANRQAVAQSCNRITASDLGNETAPSSDGLIAEILGAATPPSPRPEVQLLRYNLVCEAAASSENRFRQVSVVAEYMLNDSTIVSQFEFGCRLVIVGGSESEWEIMVSGGIDNTVTTPPSAMLNTTVRRDCAQCLSPMRSGTTHNNTEHCLGEISYSYRVG